MAQYDNTHSSALFKNDKVDNPKRPDYTGNLNVDGIEFRISGWIREGANGKFISGSVQIKEAAKSVDNNEDAPF